VREYDRIGFNQRSAALAFRLAVILVIVVQAVPRVGVGVIQVVVDVHRIVEVLTPSQIAVGLDFVRKALSIRIGLICKAVAIAPSSRGLQVHINGMTDQMV